MRQRRKDCQPSLFASLEPGAEAVEPVLPVNPQEAVGAVAQVGRGNHAYITGKELDRIVRETYARYDALKRKTGCRV
jgi:hypothetical protein